MNDYVFQLLIVIISSGALGTIVTAISRKRERQNMNNIEKIVKEETKEIRSTMSTVVDNQKNMAEELVKICNKLERLQKQQDTLDKKFTDFEKESEDLDLFMVTKLREKKIFNGESDEFFRKLIEYKDKQEEKDK